MISDLRENLIGKTVKKVFIDKKKSTLIFQTETENIFLRAEGDCCSQSWFAYWNLYGIGSKINEIPDCKTCSFEDDPETKFYLYEIQTETGERFKILMINDSNGYYGGDIGVETQAVSPEPGPRLRIGQENDYSEIRDIGHYV